MTHTLHIMVLWKRRDTCPLLAYIISCAVSLQYTNASNSSTLHIECCDIRNTLAHYIADRGGLREPECDTKTCNMDKEVRLFIDNTFSVLGSSLHIDEQQEFHVNLDTLTSESFAELLVWAFMGRFVTKHQNGEEEQTHKFLQYNTISHQITVQEPQCSFQETVYQMMISIAILAIIGIMLLQTVAEQDMCHTTKNPPEKCSEVYKDVRFKIDNYQAGHNTIRFR